MRAPLLILLCASAAVACHSDALSPERSFEPESRQQLGTFDGVAISAPTNARTLTTSARRSLAEPVSLTARFEAIPNSTYTEVTTPESEIAPDAAVTHVHYALARHLERAEQFRGETQLFDFGERGDAKYTLGGWLGHEQSREQHEGKSTLRLTGSNLKLILPSDRDERSQLTLALRAFGPGKLAVHWNGQLASTAMLSGGLMETVSFMLPASMMKHGDNVLELRLMSRGETHEPGFALDYASLGPKLPKTERPKPTPLAEFRPEARRDRLIVPAGVTLTYTLEVPARARWEAALSAYEPAQLLVSVERDGEAPKVLGSLDAGTNPKRAHFDLRAYAGQVVRLQLRADHADVALDEPAVTALDEPTQPAAARRPIRNVIVYLVDTLRADRLAPYNRKTRVQTPGLSRFVEGAAVLTNARSQENWTKPSVATLLSSLLPWEHDTYEDASVLPNSVQVLPELLQQQGYYTAGFIANGYVSDKFGFKRGWSTYRNYIREGRRSVAQAVASDVLDFLDQRPQNKPFFLYVHSIDTHVPYQPPRDYLELYDSSKSYEGPINFQKKSALLEEIKLGRLPVAPRDRERLLSLYDAAISYHDVYFNVIMNGLEQRGLDDDTMVIVTADHGEEFWDHGSVGHGHSLYDELLHVPLIMRVPGVTHAGDRVRSNVGLVDIAPTILEALGMDPPETMTGQSFLPELQGEVADAPRGTVAGFMDGSRSMAVGRFKLVQHELTQQSLYDTRADPEESRDVAAERPITLSYVRGMLGLTLGRDSGSTPRTQVAHAAKDAQIDENTERQLRALGYVGSSRPE
jgi:choline-sulfatase